MQQQPHTEVLIDGVWCVGHVWDWETDEHEWWAVVSVRQPSGETHVARVPESHVRETSRPRPATPRAGPADGAAALFVPSPRSDAHPVSDARASF